MKLLLFFAFLAVLATAVSAWTKEDHEIFDLVSAVEGSEGRGTTFYSWLGVPSTATTSEISKAYRKKSMLLHPDKNPNVKGVQERFARLGVVAAILRNQEGRERYDFFYKNGVPKWRGTGYYYSRFRPGLGFVFVFLTILTSVLQYLVQHLGYKSDVQRIERVVSDARAAAWGSKMVPIEGQRKVKVNLGGQSQEGAAVNGRWIDMVVEGPNVYILDESGDLHPLDASTATPPAVTRTWFIALLRTLASKVYTPKLAVEEPAETETDDTESEAPESGSATPKEKRAPKDGVPASGDLKGGRAPAVKAGGKRKKAVKKR
ncbi:hypothetical protein PLICRDRAFT_33936 [Plicaturopsis crispa FD-325 SS-3]|nr:hypothetical protein PLICRDRAFT_33936 [Plicaturopsis crispa FD-325 SS-3]